MASARAENFLPSQNSFLFNLAADWIMRDLAKGLEDPRFPKKLHEAFWWGNLRWVLILAVGVTGVAVAKDYIDKNITVGAGSQPEPNSTNAGIPGSFTETMRVLDTPTPHPTETLTPTRLPTFTLTPTETPTPTTTAEIIPAEVRQYSVDGVDLRPQKINGEWVWSNSENKTILTWDAKSQKVMVYSQTKEGTMIFRMDAELGYIQDLSGWSDDSAREAIKNWGAATKVDVSGLKGFDLRVIAEDFDKTGKVLGMDYTEISLKNGEFIYVEKPTIEGNYLIIYYHPSKYMRGSEYFDWLETYKSKGGSYSFVSNVLGQAQIGYSINSVYVTSTPILQGNIDGLDLRPVDIGN